MTWFTILKGWEFYDRPALSYENNRVAVSFGSEEDAQRKAKKLNRNRQSNSEMWKVSPKSMFYPLYYIRRPKT